MDAEFEISIEAGIWFAGRLLDYAMPINGEIVCDEQRNTQVAAALRERIVDSFALP